MAVATTIEARNWKRRRNNAEPVIGLRVSKKMGRGGSAGKQVPPKPGTIAVLGLRAALASLLYRRPVLKWRCVMRITNRRLAVTLCAALVLTAWVSSVRATQPPKIPAYYNGETVYITVVNQNVVGITNSSGQN